MSPLPSNALERAVIAAARSYSRGEISGEKFNNAVRALEAWEATQLPEVMEIGWHELAEGDALRSAKNGRFYEVTNVLKVKAGYEIKLNGVPNKISRPTPAEPTAWVQRGTTGTAVDTLTHVFSSGG